MGPIPDFGRCVLLLQCLLTQSLPKRWVSWLHLVKLLKSLALPRGIEPLFQP